MITFRRRPLTVALAFATVALAVAPGADAVALPGAPTPADVCAMLSAVDVTTLLGKPAKPVPGTNDIVGSSCLWTGDRVAIGVTIETDPLLKAQGGKNGTVASRFKMMEDEVAAKRAKAVPGVGDKAVWQSNMLWVMKGAKVALIFMSRKGMGPADDLPGAKAVAAKVLTKL